MKFKRRFASLILCGAMILSNVNLSFADATKVVTLGVNNSPQQRQTILKYFGVNENDVEVIYVNNQEERQYLEGVATEAQIGRKTYSCSYVQPTSSGGINVKTANLTWLTSGTVASTLTTAGLKNADVVVASVIPASGTGSLAGIMKAFEVASGEKLDESKKELANEELVITGDLGDDIGQDKATGIVNDIKTEVIKNGTSDTTQIAETINNITNIYNVNLSEEQINKLISLMEKISKEDYDYNSIKNTLNSVKDIVNENLKSDGVKIDQSFWDSVKDFFRGIGESISGIFNSNSKDLGILGTTNDNVLGKDAIIDATDKSAINLPSSEQVEGFLTKLWNWVTGLFNKDEKAVTDNKTEDVIEEKDEESIVTEDGIPSDNITGDTQINSNDMQEDLNVKAEDDIIADEIIEVDDNETQE